MLIGRPSSGVQLVEFYQVSRERSCAHPESFFQSGSTSDNSFYIVLDDEGRRAR